MGTKKISFFIYIFVVSMFLFTPASEAASKHVAKVNEVMIKAMTLDAAINNFIENQKLLGVGTKEEDKEKLKADILEELISAELLYQASQKAGLPDLTTEIQVQFDSIKKGFASDEEFGKLLEDRGISEQDLKDDVKRGIYITEFLDKNVFNNLIITEEEKKDEYEKSKQNLAVPDLVRASHILIRVAGDASDVDKKIAKERIEELRKRVQDGEDFVKLAQEHSGDATASRGGDLGYFKRGDMVKPFEDAAFGLETGQLSKVVETQFGYHIIKITDKKVAHTMGYEEVEDDVAVFLVNEKKKEALDEFVADLRSKAKIEIY